MLAPSATTTVIMDDMDGRWEVFTRGARYIVDLDARTLRRQPSRRDDEWAPSRLTKDRRRLHLVRVDTCIVPLRGRFVVAAPGGQAYTRLTSPLVAIRRLD